MSFDAQQFCISDPLYKTIPAEYALVRGFLESAARFDCFCEQCNQDTVILGIPVPLATYWNTRDEKLNIKQFECTRNPEHRLFFIFRIVDNTITKIGQYPSKASLDEVTVKKYKGVLDNENLKELTRAIGLASHGVGIGSFVYLRRIFERLIEAAHRQEKTTEGWDEESFIPMRMAEKIQVLAHALPDFLVEQRALYSILSKGIHELSEEECLAHFEIVQTGIELILDQKVAERNQRLKMEKAAKSIPLLAAKIKNP